MTELEDEIQSLIDLLPDVPVKQRGAIMRQIARLRVQVRAISAQLTACEHDPSAYLLQLDAVEVTQTVQNLSNSVPLIAGKPTIARVYLSYYGASPIRIGGTLQAAHSGTAAVSVPSIADVLLDPSHAGDTAFKRKDVSLSLNFLLPPAQITPGALTLTLSSITNTATHAMIPVAYNSAHTVTLQAGHPLRVRVLAVRYRQNNRTFLATANDLNHLRSWLGRAYPVSNVIWSTGTIDARAAVPFGSGDINAQLAAIRALDVSAGTDKRTHYYGIVSDGGFFMRGSAAGIPSTPSPATVASGPTGPADWGWDFDGSYGDWYGGHELGHTFGRFHPGFCGESHDDPAYPYTAGQLANNDFGMVGLDVGDASLGIPMRALPGPQWHDVMTYCQTQWLSDYTYSGILTRVGAEDALPAGPVPAGVPVPAPAAAAGAGGRPDQRFPSATALEGRAVQTKLISMVAPVNLTSGQGKIQYVHPVDQGDATPIDPQSPVLIRVRAADGGLLHEFAAPVQLDSELGPNDQRRGLVDAVLPVDRDAVALELVIHGQVVDTYRSSPRPPALASAAVVGLEDDAVHLTWSTAGAPDASHTYAVQVSTDGGRTWQTLAVGLTEPTARIDRSQFGPGQTVQVRVIATDGFTSSEAVTETFTT